MEAILILLILCLHLQLILSSCPNFCSGHGECDKFFRCTCYKGPDGELAWTGNDCSLRTCPKYDENYLFFSFVLIFLLISIRDVAWIGPVVKANDVHPITECSNKGICNRYTGICECFENFEGIACERSVCLNNCNNQGVCYTAKQLAEDAGRVYDTPWDADKFVGCVCDIGFRGPDCRLGKVFYRAVD
jgi:hypothetical protein